MDNSGNKSGSTTTGIIIGVLVLLCCVGVIALGGAGYLFYTAFPTEITDSPVFSDSPTAQPQVTRIPVESITSETLEILQNTIVPINNSKDLACRLNNKCDVPDVVATSAVTRVVGDKENFWVSNLDTLENVEVQATLRYVTEHSYFWVQDDVEINESEMTALMEEFENKIYPTNREFFGTEWTPGIDGDEHIYILYARGLGFSVAGYFSSADASHPLIQEFSNAHEMFIFNADNTPLDASYTYGVLAHEFQHMIHWNNDLNETSWINEGSAELAAFINGYNPGSDWLYINDTDLQLNDWPNDGDTGPHYGAGFLFMNYFLNRFGEEATQLLVKDDANGFESVEDVLLEIQATDPLTGQPITADLLFMDWVVTNFLLDSSIADGRYDYANYPDANQASETETIYDCPQETFSRTVHQYAADYIAIECSGDFTINFTGSTVTGLLPADPYSGSYAFWSNKGDESDMTLTREFDFTNVNAPIELSFRTWYDIELDWDYVYVEVSENGETWEILTTPSGTGTDPSGNSYGWGYTGTTDWKEETVDLSAYAGKKVFVRFEYVTDAAVNGEGFMIDDIQISAANYQTDFEADDGGWTAEGFVRVQNTLPQTFGLALILTDDSSVTMIPVNPDQTAQIQISLSSGNKAYLVVSGLTRFTRELASYQIEIE